MFTKTENRDTRIHTYREFERLLPGGVQGGMLDVGLHSALEEGAVHLALRTRNGGSPGWGKRLIRYFSSSSFCNDQKDDNAIPTIRYISGFEQLARYQPPQHALTLVGTFGFVVTVSTSINCGDHASLRKIVSE
eukprot:500501-Prorocentrum_minimum.AAC.4